ncbi:MAG: methionyl-tRNA formyltransferase [Nitrospiraceae bacterium]
MRIIFMGTPEFAVPSLVALLTSDDEVVGVVTQPDRPKGRGQTLTPPPVKVLAQQHGKSVIQPTKMKDPALLEALKAWNPDLIVVVAFGRILPPSILALPPHGCVNVHGSLLPKYRGAAPIQWAVINGEQETGITTMLMDEGMDTGAMLLREATAIRPDDTSGTLAERLSQIGARLLIETLRRLKAGQLQPIPQDNARATLAPIIKKEHGVIDWSLSAAAIVNRIRGFTPWPGSSTYLGDERWTIWRAMVVPPDASLTAESEPGTFLRGGKDGILVRAGDGVVAVMELQVPGSRRMSAGDFLAGHRLQPGARLGGPSKTEHSATSASA